MYLRDIGYFYKGTLPTTPAPTTQTVVRTVYVDAPASTVPSAQSFVPSVTQIETGAPPRGGIDWSAMTAALLPQPQPQQYLEPESSETMAPATATTSSDLTSRLPYVIALGALALLAILLLRKRSK